MTDKNVFNQLYKIMRFKQWFLIEDFNTQKEKYTKQGIDPDIVAKYLADFRVIKDKKYKQINDPIHGLENIKNRSDIDQYQDFHQLEVLVDYVKGQVDVGGKASYKNLNFSGKPIYEDQNIQIFYADTPRACIEYKGNAPYGWCVARNDSSNLFYAYRYKDHQPAFYFVKNKQKTNIEFGLMQGIKNVVSTVASQSSKFKDKYHFFVIQVIRGANPKDHTKKQYVVTSAENDGDKQMSWDEIIKIEPHLQDKEEIFQPKPLTKEESEFYNKYKNGISNEEFIKLPYDQKDMFINIYVRLDRGLTDEQYQSLPEDLKNKYIGFGVGLSDEQYNNTSDKLKKRYVDVTIKKIETLIEQKRELKLKNSEVEIFKNNINKFDLNKLSGDSVLNLLKNATDKQEIAKLLGQDIMSKLSDFKFFELLRNTTDKQEIAKLIIQNKKELSGDGVRDLLYNAIDRQEIAKLLGQDNMSKLSGSNVYNLLNYAVPPQHGQHVTNIRNTNLKEKQEIAKLLGQDNMSKLSGNDVYDLLKNATDKQEIAKLLGQDNMSKLSDNSVRNLLKNSTDKQEIAKLIGKNNINKLSDDNVYILLYHATDKQETAKLLGQDNMSKLSDNSILDLLDQATDKQEMAKLIIQNNKELSSDSVYNLLYYATDKQETAKLLGQDNISKLSYDSVRDLLYSSTERQEMAKLLGQDNVNKLSAFLHKSFAINDHQ
jgi:hypothetical protein